MNSYNCRFDEITEILRMLQVLVAEHLYSTNIEENFYEETPDFCLQKLKDLMPDFASALYLRVMKTDHFYNHKVIFMNQHA